MENDNEKPKSEKIIFSDDPRTLKVRGGTDSVKKPTDPTKLSMAILHVLSEHEYVKILTVGPVALNIAMKAFRLAAVEAEKITNGAVLVCRQSEYAATIGGSKTKGVCTRIFAIPITSAL